MKIASIVGARPHFIKLAPITSAVSDYRKAHGDSSIEHVTIHTGQHYDYQMNKVFFDELQIPPPQYNLGVGSGSHGWQTAEMIKRIENVLLKERPTWALVYGDTNSTLAGALAAAKTGFPLAHIEAGLRSYNRAMPEELNRVLTDHCSDILFCPTKNAVDNLHREGFVHTLGRGHLFDPGRTRIPEKDFLFPIVVNVGDIMVDVILLASEIAAKKSRVLETLGLDPKKYLLATVHRAENTDKQEVLKSLMDTFAELHDKERPLVFLLHPRTKEALVKMGIYRSVVASMLVVDPPVGYFDMITLEKHASKILTDSGGVQKEAFFFSVPCLTLRSETEWTETTEMNLNTIVGTKKTKIKKAANAAGVEAKAPRAALFGKGAARTLILDILVKAALSRRRNLERVL